MRISDWSSDVCSSDLSTTPVCRTTGVALAAPAWGRPRVPVSALPDFDPFQQQVELGLHRLLRLLAFLDVVHRVQHAGVVPGRGRSEEHTSELQSLMRISYAVFCLKKKKKTIKMRHC